VHPAGAVTLKTCLRCDWEGDTKDVGCPNCGVPLYLAGASPSVTVEAPAGSDPEERSRDATSTERVGLSATRSPGLDPPTSPRDALGSPGRSIRSAGPFVLAALVLTVVLGTWLRSHEEGARSASTDAAVSETPISDGSPTPAVTPARSGPVVGPIQPAPIGRNTLTVEGIPFSFRVPTPGWDRFGGISINKSTVGPQSAEAIIFWTRFPDGEYADPCGDLLGLPVGSSAADLAAAVSRAPGTELVAGPSDVTVGGHAAKHVVLTVREDLGCDPGFFFTWQDAMGGPLWPLTNVGDTIRVWIVEVDGTPIFIEAETTTQAGSRLEHEIQQIVGSIRFY
jgi:hypothetical protein